MSDNPYGPTSNGNGDNSANGNGSQGNENSHSGYGQQQPGQHPGQQSYGQGDQGQQGYGHAGSGQPQQPQPGQPGQQQGQQPGQGGFGQPGQQQGQPQFGQPGQQGFAGGPQGYPNQPGQPGQPGQNPQFGGPQNQNFGQQGQYPYGQPGGAQPYGAMNNNSGGSGKSVGLIIGALILVIALIVGAYFLFVGNDDNTDPSASESNSSSSESSEESGNWEDSLTSDSSASSSSVSGYEGYGSADDSLPAKFKTDLPKDVSDWVYGCEEVSFTLQYEDDSSADRDMDGYSCKGATNHEWAFRSIDFIDDAEYATNVVERTKSSGYQQIIEDEPSSFVAMDGDYNTDTLIISNPDKGVVLEVEYMTEDSMKKVLKEMGYSVN